MPENKFCGEGLRGRVRLVMDRQRLLFDEGGAIEERDFTMMGRITADTKQFPF
jgi:hypothetical protein